MADLKMSLVVFKKNRWEFDELVYAVPSRPTAKVMASSKLTSLELRRDVDTDCVISPKGNCQG
jgi:hypothetical protein